MRNVTMNNVTTLGIAGKGGAGKTTLAANLARLVARSGRRVAAIDADSDPHLALALGLSPEAASGLRPLLEQSEGSRRLPDHADPGRLLDDYGVVAPDGVRVLLAARAEVAGAG